MGARFPVAAVAIIACAAFAGTASAQPGRIAFARTFACDTPPADNCPPGSDIDSVVADGTSLRLVAHDPVPPLPGSTLPPSIAELRYSRSGASLVIRTFGGDLVVAKADGSAVRTFPDFGCGNHPDLCFKVRDAGWSPDGKRVVLVAGFSTPAHDGIGDLYVMGRYGSGSTLRRLTRNAWVESASWSSRGVIAYAVGKPGSATSRLDHGQILTISPSGGQPHVLVHGSGDFRRRNEVTVSSPVWAPDGKRLLFERTRDNGDHRWVLASASGRIIRTLHIPGTAPAWSFDGRWIASTDGDLWVTRVSGGTAHRIVGPIPSYVIGSPTWVR
jgi:hypothetical protein